MNKVNVVIPTHGRPAGLAAALAAVAQQSTGDLVVTVVENGSDEALAVAAAYGADYHHLGSGNASAARNYGASAVEADVVVFLDDDAVPQPGWLSALVAPILGGEADATVGGVQVAVCGQVPDSVRGAYVDTSMAMDPARPFLIGMNMAISRSVFLAAGGFRCELGPGAVGGHEDVLLGLVLAQAARRIRFVPEAEVVHTVPAERLTASALLDRAAGQGRGEGWVQHHWFGRTPRLLRLRLVRSRSRLKLARTLDSRREWTTRYWRERQMLQERNRPAVLATVRGEGEPTD